MPKKELIVTITGSRTWDAKKYGLIASLMVGTVTASDRPVRFFVGDCPTGVDNIVLEVANKFGYEVNIFVADWTKHGKAAGPIRNGEMISRKPDVVYAFRAEGTSPGTDDCIRQAKEAGIPVYLVTIA